MTEVRSASGAQIGFGPRPRVSGAALSTLIRGGLAAVVATLARPSTTHAPRDDPRVLRVVPAPDPPPAAPTIARAEALLLEVEAILLHLDDEARIDVLVELDRLGDICKAADPIAVSRAVPRNTGANRSSVVMSSEDDED